MCNGIIIVFSTTITKSFHEYIVYNGHFHKAVDIEPKVGSIKAVVIEPKVTCALFWDLENF